MVPPEHGVSTDDTGGEMRSLAGALSEALVNTWIADTKFVRLVNEAWLIAGLDPSVDFAEKAKKVQGVLRQKYVDPSMPVRAFVAKNMYAFSETMWAGRSRDSCLVSAEKALGLAGRVRRGSQFIRSRENDKSHDWKTVK